MDDPRPADEPAALNLEIHVGVGGPAGHPVTATSDAGEAEGTFRLPPAWGEFEGSLRDFRDARLPARGGASALGRGASGRSTGTARDLGQALFQALFAGRLSRWYDRSRGRADALQRAVRLGLRIDDPTLAALPWELLFDPDQATDGDHLCLTNVTLVRRLSVLAGKAPVTAQLPLRILGMAAAPPELPTLDVAGEVAAVKRALAELGLAELVTLEWVEGGTLGALRAALERGPWHVFHFIGHGEPGALSFVREHEGEPPVRAEVVAQLLDNHPSLRLVVLNACEGATAVSLAAFSSAATTLVGRGVPAVVAMQSAITDAAATHFARAFYEAIAARRPLGTAVTLAREAVFAADAEHAEWGAPVLFLRTTDDRLFDLTAPLVGEAAPGDAGWGARAKEFVAISQDLARDPSNAVTYGKRAESYLAASALTRATDPARAAWYAELATADLRRAATLQAETGRTDSATLRGLAAAAAVVTAEALRGGVAATPDGAGVHDVAARNGLLASPDRLRGVEILWVDDQPESVAGEAAALRAMGARVDLSVNTSDALAKLRAQRYALVLSDLMRGDDKSEGYRLLSAMREPSEGAPPDGTPVIFYSWPSVGAQETLEEAIALRRGVAQALGADYACFPQDLLDRVLRVVAARPVVARFEGVTVTLCLDDAGAGRFEARSAEGVARYAVDTLAFVDGALPIRARRIVEAWAELRATALREAVECLRAGRPTPTIAPLG